MGILRVVIVVAQYTQRYCPCIPLSQVKNGDKQFLNKI
jgi:hypothetical protein